MKHFTLLFFLFVFASSKSQVITAAELLSLADSSGETAFSAFLIPKGYSVTSYPEKYYSIYTKGQNKITRTTSSFNYSTTDTAYFNSMVKSLKQLGFEGFESPIYQSTVALKNTKGYNINIIVWAGPDQYTGQRISNVFNFSRICTKPLISPTDTKLLTAINLIDIALCGSSCFTIAEAKGYEVSPFSTMTIEIPRSMPGTTIKHPKPTYYELHYNYCDENRVIDGFRGVEYTTTDSARYTALKDEFEQLGFVNTIIAEGLQGKTYTSTQFPNIQLHIITHDATDRCNIKKTGYTLTVQDITKPVRPEFTNDRPIDGFPIKPALNAKGKKKKK